MVDYCFSALAYAKKHKGFELSSSRVGIVGAGAVGGLFATKLENLGVEVRCYDPFLAQAEQCDREYSSLADVLACNVVSLHVPLTNSGAHPTHKLLSAAELALLGSNAVLINACRGGVVDEAALKQLLVARNDIVTVFDVWAGEPIVDTTLVKRVDIATPHIAGYSMEAKSNATAMLARAFTKHFAIEGDSLNEARIEESNRLPLETESASLDDWDVLLAAFPLIELSKHFKQAVSQGVGKDAFDLLRRQLVQRREFKSRVLEKGNFSREQQARLAVLGFCFD